MIIGITGHRPNKLFGFDIDNPKYDPIRNKIKQIFLDKKPEKIISGMALGIDTIAAEIALDLGIPFIAAVPFVGQEKLWPPESKETFVYLCSKASEVVIVSEGGYESWKMQKRNEWIVDNCNLLLAIWTGGLGGTKNCVDYAKSLEKEILVIKP